MNNKYDQQAYQYFYQ